MCSDLTKTGQMLARRFRDGDETVFNELVSDYHPLIWRRVRFWVGNEEDALDICQEVFLAAYKNLEQLRDLQKFNAWISQIAYNQSMSFLRQKARHQRMLERQQKRSEMFSPDYLLERIDLEDKTEALRRFLLELKTDLQRVIQLFYLENLSHQEIASELGIPKHQVDNLLRKSRAQLRKRFGEEFAAIFAQTRRRISPVPETLAPRITSKIQDGSIPRSQSARVKRILPPFVLLGMGLLFSFIFQSRQSSQPFDQLEFPPRVQSHPVFQTVSHLELRPLFRTYDRNNVSHRLHVSWREVKQMVLAPHTRYEGVEGLISIQPVTQGQQMFQVFLSGQRQMRTYLLATQQTVTPFNAAQFFGWSFSPKDALLWASLVRLDHMRLRKRDVRDDLYTIGDHFVGQPHGVVESEIDFAHRVGFQLVREEETDSWWVLERIFLAPIFVDTATNCFYLCWSRLSTADAYRLQMRQNRGKWQEIYKGERNVFSFLPQSPGHYEFRVRPVLITRDSVTQAIKNDRRGLEERYSSVRAVDFPLGHRAQPPPLLREKSPSNWQFRSAFFNWRYEGWQHQNYTGQQTDARIIQHPDGTVTISDSSPMSNLYIMHETDWSVPFTVQVRLKVDEIRGSGEIGTFPVISCLTPGDVGVSIQPVLRFDGIATWYGEKSFPVDTTAFHTYTIVVNEEGSGEVYVDADFFKPALQVPFEETIFFPGNRLEIGSPTQAISTITIDYAAIAEGSVRQLATYPDWIVVEEESIAF